MTIPLPCPVTNCLACEKQWSTLWEIHCVWIAKSYDPGARAQFEAAVEDYETHHHTAHGSSPAGAAWQASIPATA